MKTEKQIRYLAYTAVFASLITVFTAYFVHVPVGTNGGYIHLGDSLIYLAAALLPKPYAMLAGAIGGGMADLLTAPMWTVPTLIIKARIVLPLSAKGSKIISKRNVVGPIISFLISGTGYYIADAVLFGTKAAILASFSGSFIQSIGSAVVFYALGKAMDKAGIKERLFSFNESLKWNGKEGEING